MKAKFAAGNKVRIKSQDFLDRVLNPNFHQYENMVGEIIESTNIVAFMGNSELNLNNYGEHITVYHYTVKINDQTILYDVLEESLEISP